MTLAERLARHSKPDASGCVLWTSSSRAGYGRIELERNRWASAHRVSYELAHGPIPDGMTIDHLCRVRRCVNVEHLEIVTVEENIRRGLAYRSYNKTRCPNGHEYGIDGDPGRGRRGKHRCDQCRHDRNAARRAAYAARKKP